MIKKISPITVARIIALLTIFLGLARLSYVNTDVVRWVVAGVTGCTAFFAYARGKNIWTWVLAITAILFNPITPIHFNRESWLALNMSAFAIIFTNIFKLRIVRPRFTSLHEFYQAIDGLIEKLRAESCDDEANQLHSLLHQTTWTTSGELLGELMLALKSMNGSYSAKLSDDIAECLEFAIRYM